MAQNRYKLRTRPILLSACLVLVMSVVPALDASSIAADRLEPLRSEAVHTGAYAPTWAPSLAGSPVEYLVLTNRDMAPEFERLAEWKTRKGVPAVVRTLDDVRGAADHGSDLAETIRNYIQDAYRFWGVRFVLLGGDTDVVPARYIEMQIGSSKRPPSELYYSCLDGSWNADGDASFGEESAGLDDPGDAIDLVSEVFLGRAPVSTALEARVFVDKTLQYETPERLDFQDKTLFLAEVLFPSNYTPGGPLPAADGAEFAEEIAFYLAPWTRTTRLYEAQALWPGSEALTVTGATNAINAGYGTVVHVGHGWRYTLSSGDGSLDVRDAAQFDSGGRSGLFYLLNCTATAFDFESMAETLLLNPNGGACAVVGASREAFPLSVRNYQSAFFDHLYRRAERQVGVAMARSREQFVSANMSRIDRWTQLVYTLLGDPELPIWTRARSDLRVNGVPQSLEVGAERLVLEVRNASEPVVGARVCVYKPGDEYRIAQTDSAGVATIDVELQTEGTVQLTVTAPDYVHHEETLTARARGVALALVDVGLVDGVGGDGTGSVDARLDAGETAELWPRLRNMGTGSARALTATLVAIDPGVDILQASATYADLAADTEAGPAAPFMIRAHPDLADGSVVTLTLELNYNNEAESRRIELLVHAARPRLVGLRLDDSRAGNGNGVQESGEEVDLYYTVENRGSGTAISLEVNLDAADAGLEVITSRTALASVPPGARVEMSTPLAIREADIAARPTAQLVLVHLQDNVGSARRVDFRVPAAPVNLSYGKVNGVDHVDLAWDPVEGDDALGYYIYRAPSSSGPFVRVSVGVVPQAYFRDAGLAPSTRYHYVVRTVDGALLEGPSSAVLSVSTNPGLLEGWPIALGQFTSSTPAVGDVTGDGVLDVVAAADQVFAWNAHGVELADADSDPLTWGVLHAADTGDGFGPVSVANIDAAPGEEIIAVTWGDAARYAVILDSHGAPLPGWPQPLVPALANVAGSQVPPVVVDIDGEPGPEILVAARDGRLYGWHADGSEIADGDADASTHGVLLDTGSAFLRCAPGVADLDPTRPGLETAVGTTNGTLHLLDAHGQALSGWPRTTFGAGISFGPLLSSGISIADLDRDGQLEMIFLESAGRLHAMHVDGSESPGFPVGGIAAQSLSVTPSPAIANIQGDAQLEVVVAGSDGIVHVFDARGNGLLSQSIGSGTSSESSPLLGDVDGDGDIEIVLGDEAGILRAWKLDGSEADGFPIAIGSEVRATPILRDLDGNGTADLVVQGWDGVVRVHDLGVPWVPARFPWPEHRGNASRTGVAHADDTTPVLLSELVAGFDARSGVHLSWRGETTAEADDLRWLIRRAGPFESEPQDTADWMRDANDVGERHGVGNVTFVDPNVQFASWYAYAVIALDDTGAALAGRINVRTVAPGKLKLLPAVPNPFNPGTRIAFDVPGGSEMRVRLVVYDAHGRTVRRLLDRSFSPGRHACDWDGHDENGKPTASGVYIVRLESGRAVLSQKLVRLQ